MASQVTEIRNVLTSSKGNRIAELDALRGIAALLVFFFHCTLFRPEAAYGFKLGVTGVDLFFMISGFVIFLTLKQTAHWKDFIINRFTRLYPTYWTCVSITAILIIVRQLYLEIPADNFLNIYLANLTMFQSHFAVPHLDEQYWTLEVEMLFYVTMLVIFIMKKENRIEIIGYSICAAIILYDVFLERYAFNVYRTVNALFPLINHFPLFFSGILLYKVKFEKPAGHRFAGLAFCFLVTILLFRNGGRSMYYITLAEYGSMLALYFAMFLFIVHGKFNFIVSKPTLFLGRISYSFYLIHQYMSSNVIIPFLQDHFGVPFFISVICSLGVSVVVAFLVTAYIEEPVIKYGRTLLRGKSLKKKIESVS